MSQKPLISVVVCTKNDADTIKECLDSVFKLDYPNKEIIVVDGCSTDGTLDIVKKFDVKVFSDEGKGLAYARDLGWRMAKGDYIAYIDADMVVNSDWISHMLKKFRKDERLAGVEDLTLSFKDANYLSKLDSYGYRVFDLKRTSKKWVFKTIGTANSMWRRKALEDVNGFDHNFKYTHEDGDLSHRVYKHGWRLGRSMDAISHHHFRATWIGVYKRQFYYGYGNYQFARKHNIRLRKTFLKWFISPIAGIKHAIVAYQLTKDKICIIFPFHYTIKKYMSIIGYFKALIDSIRGKL